MVRQTTLVVIGAGPWALRHLAAIESDPELALVGVISRSAARAGQLQLEGVGQQPAAIWPDIASMLAANVTPDGAILVQRPSDMFEVCKLLIAQRIAVLAEKPLTLSSQEAQTIASLAESNNTLLMVNLIHLFSAGYAAFQEELASLGELRTISTLGGNLGPYRTYMPGLWDYGPHELAFVLDIAGRMPTEVSATLLKGDELKHVIQVRLEFSGGLQAILTFGNLMCPKRRELVCASASGELILQDYPDPTLRRGDQVIPFSGAMPLNRVLSTFARQIPIKSDKYRTGELAVRINKVLETIASQLWHPR